MTTISYVNTSYEKLPLADLTAPKALSQRNSAGNTASNESILQDSEDARTILKLLGFDEDQGFKNTIEAKEKYMIETEPMINTAACASKTLHTGMKQKDARKPHYTRLLVFDRAMVFQAACCLPLKVVAASLDGEPVSGRVLFNSHSEEGGGKLVYEFAGKGTELIIDLKRGMSTKAQRLIFRGIEGK